MSDEEPANAAEVVRIEYVIAWIGTKAARKEQGTLFLTRDRPIEGHDDVYQILGLLEKQYELDGGAGVTNIIRLPV